MTFGESTDDAEAARIVCAAREDGVNFVDCADVYNKGESERMLGRCQTAFGIGTNLTNDLGFDPLQIVIKMTRCNGQPVAKISDEPSKTMDYDPSYVAYLREVFQVPDLPAR
jgi:nicotinic acid phosphoribosyltransferase